MFWEIEDELENEQELEILEEQNIFVKVSLENF